MIFIPKLYTTLKTYDRTHFIKDAMAGVIVGIVAIPLALAFAIASGVSPEKGLITAIVGGLIVSLLGGSRVQIAGPTGAFVVIVYDIIAHHGLDGLMICTLMAGMILIIMGFSGMGSMIKFIPYPVITGFTSGIAVIIFSAQVKDLFGLKMGAVPAEFIDKWLSYAEHLSGLSWHTAGLGLFSLAVLYLFPKWTKKVPAPIVALLAATLLAQVFHLPVETIGSRFGALPRGIPFPSLPSLDVNFAALIRPATTVAILAAIESLLSAVVADGMIGGRHRSNMELVAQGAANVASPLFGGIPVTGAIARTATNVKSGGRTPVSGIVHAAVLLLVSLFLSKWVSLIPLAALAAVLVVVSYHMSEWRSFVSLLKSPRSDVVVLLTTFSLTVLVDLTVAVEVGMVLAAFLFMRRMANVTQVEALTRDRGEDETAGDKKSDAAEGKLKVPAGVEIYEINGPLFFGAAGKLGEILGYMEKPPKVFILQMENVPVMDATGLRALEEFHKRCKRQGTALVLAGIRVQPLSVLVNSEKIDKFGQDNIAETLKDAIARAQTLIETAAARPRKA